MKRGFRKLSALVLAIGMTFSLAVGIGAASSDYSVNVTAGKQVQFIRDNKVVAKYDAYQTDMTVKKNKSGSIILSFAGASRTMKNISVGAQDTLVISGTVNSLTLDKTLPLTLDVAFKGSADTLVVDAPITLSIADQADVVVLEIKNSAAQVTAQKGSLVQETYAVDKKTVTGVKKVYGLTAPTSGNKTTTVEDMTNKQGKIETVLLIESRDKDTQNTKELSIDGDYEVSFTAKTGMSLGSCMRDLQFSVERTDTSNKVGGSWKWLTGEYNTTTSGTYYYQFKPSLSQYGTMTVKVNYTASGNSRSMDKPGLRFGDDQRSHGAAGTVDIHVSYPKQLEDDDQLIIMVGSTEVGGGPFYLSESDAGETDDFSVDVSGSAGDKVKIKVRIKRAVGGGTVTSSTITYQID